MKRVLTTAAAVAALTFGLAAAQAQSGGKFNLSPTAANSSSPLDATEMSGAKKKKKPMRRVGRSGTSSKAGTGGGAAGESGSGSAARGAQGRGPTR